MEDCMREQQIKNSNHIFEWGGFLFGINNILWRKNRNHSQGIHIWIKYMVLFPRFTRWGMILIDVQKGVHKYKYNLDL